MSKEVKRYCTVKESLEDSLKEVKLYREGKIQLQTWDEFRKIKLSKEVEKAKEILSNLKVSMKKAVYEEVLLAIQTILSELDRLEKENKELNEKVYFEFNLRRDCQRAIKQKDKVIEAMTEELVGYGTNPMFGHNFEEVIQYFENRAKESE